jgi:Carboxypeptidase regulatory-like domain
MTGTAARGCIVLTICVCLQGCGSGATAPSGSTKNTWVPPLVVTCSSGSALGCIATFADDNDVTARASWSAADSFDLVTSGPVIASDAVVFRSPGVPTALSARNVYIRADYTSPKYGHRSGFASHAYALTPGGEPIPLASISGAVFEGPPSLSTAVPNATITILAGEGNGRSATTGVSGSFRIEFLRLGQPFTIRASKAGYSTDTRDHSGIVDDSFGYPSNASVQFNIQPVR